MRRLLALQRAQLVGGFKALDDMGVAHCYEVENSKMAPAIDTTRLAAVLYPYQTHSTVQLSRRMLGSSSCGENKDLSVNLSQT
jgi:hypothetical protein